MKVQREISEGQIYHSVQPFVEVQQVYDRKRVKRAGTQKAKVGLLRLRPN